MSEPVILENVRIKAVTSKALLVQYEDDEQWIPLSQVELDETDVDLSEAPETRRSRTPDANSGAQKVISKTQMKRVERKAKRAVKELNARSIGPATLERPKGGPSAAGWHAIQDFLRCPKEYQFRHVRKLRKPGLLTPDALAVGVLFHGARAHWFARGFPDPADSKWQEALNRTFVEVASEQSLPVSLEAERRARHLFEAYSTHWFKMPRPKVVAAEYELGPAPLEKGDPFFLFRTARLDDVSRYPEAGGQLCIGESKTTSVGIKDAVNEYTLHGQTLLQFLLWKMAPQGEAKHGPAAGVLLDVIKKPYGGDKPDFGRVFIPFTDWSLEWYADSMRGYLRAAAAVAEDTEVPRNVSACTRLIGRMRVPCEFRELCRMGKSASGLYVRGDGSSLLKGEGEPWR